MLRFLAHQADYIFRRIASHIVQHGQSDKVLRATWLPVQQSYPLSRSPASPIRPALGGRIGEVRGGQRGTCRPRLKARGAINTVISASLSPLLPPSLPPTLQRTAYRPAVTASPALSAPKWRDTASVKGAEGGGGVTATGGWRGKQPLVGAEDVEQA